MHRQSIRKLGWRAVVVCGTLLVWAGISSAQLVPYDGFSGASIDFEKWQGHDPGASSETSPNFETIREIAGKKLRLLLTTRNNNTLGFGRQDAGLGLVFKDPNPITSIETVVTMKALRIQDCPAQDQDSSVGARIFGHFFNDGSSNGTNDSTGNIFAGLQILRDSVTQLNTFEAAVSRCFEPSCATSDTLNIRTFTTAVELDVPVRVRLAWQPGRDRFQFRIVPQNGVEEIQNIPYTQSDASPAQRLKTKGLSVRTAVENCPAKNRLGHVEALFDNVKVKQ